ncbi:hypothetical protein FI667_g10560, partial [Globisporangium splendens]
MTHTPPPSATAASARAPSPTSPSASSSSLVVKRRVNGRGKAETEKPKKRPKLKWRTRDSQNSHLYNLQLDINDLHQEIQSLRQMREILLAQTLNRMDDRDGSFVKVVQEYHRAFEYGYQPFAQLSNGQVVNTMEFLSSIMDERLSIGRFVGVDVLHDQWTRYSTAFPDILLKYTSSEVVPEMDYVPLNGGAARPVVMITSKASYESFVTIETIRLMFPHLLEHKSLVDKVLGKPLHGVGHFDFVFDTNTHRIIGYDFRLDLLESFTQHLQDPEDLCVLFEGAKISEESLIGDLNVYPQQSNTSGFTRDEVRYSEAAQMMARQRKLAKILDPEDRIEHVPSSSQGPVGPPPPPTFNPASRRPWQLQISTILADDPDDQVDEEEKESRFSFIESEELPTTQEPEHVQDLQQTTTHLPSLPYFPPSVFGSRTPVLGKRHLNPFGGEELPPR